MTRLSGRRSRTRSLTATILLIRFGLERETLHAMIMVPIAHAILIVHVFLCWWGEVGVVPSKAIVIHSSWRPETTGRVNGSRV